jgi:putative peptidoglycan lipid II flippase
MLLPMGLGVALPNIDQLVNKYFASFLGHGETTAMMNAYRLMLLPIGVFAQAMALAVYPTMTTYAAEKNIKALRSTMNQSLRNILFLTVPASALMFILSDPIIAFLLQSGKFTGSDTLATGSVLRSLSLGIFAWSCQSLLTRGFYALQNSRVPVASGIVVSVLFVAMNWFVVFHTHLGVAGLGYTTSIAATIHMTALLILLRFRLNGIQGERLFVSAAKTALATLALVAVSLLFKSLLTPVVAHFYPKVASLIVILLAGGLGGGAYLGAAHLMKMGELRDAIALITRRGKAKGGTIEAA